MSTFRSLLITVAIAFPVAVAGNAAAERRVNSLATDVRAACHRPRTSSPLPMAIAQSPRHAANRPNVGAMPQPLAEVVVTGHEPCSYDPRDLTPDPAAEVHHRRVLVTNLFAAKPLFESTASSPSR